ncbi:MAG: methyltransferase family protein, partial [Ignavibacteria bacterium]
IYFYIQYYFIIKEEENFLRTRFKEKFEDYSSSVNKFIPKFQPYEFPKRSKFKLNLRAGYKSEKRTFQATSFIMLMIILIFILLQG